MIDVRLRNILLLAMVYNCILECCPSGPSEWEKYASILEDFNAWWGSISILG